MKRFLKRSGDNLGKKKAAHSMLRVPRRLGSEFLEDRRLMAADSFGLSSHRMAFAETDTEATTEIEEVSDAGRLVAVADSAAANSLTYPAPDDDSPPGPIGPVVHAEQLAQHLVQGTQVSLASSLGDVTCGNDVERLAEWLQDRFDPEPDPRADAPTIDLVDVATSQPSALGDSGYPADDDNGPWGPIGPVIHQFLVGLADCQLIEPEVATDTAGPAQKVAGDAAYPAPDDDDDGGPIGPVFHDQGVALDRVATFDSYDEVFAILSAASSGRLGYPSPDDDGPWGPIGPVVREVAEQLTTLMTQAEQQGASLPSDPWGGFNGDEPVPDWRQPIVTDAVETLTEVAPSGGGVGYPADDDNGPWGPIGPVIQKVQPTALSDATSVAQKVAPAIAVARAIARA